MSRLREGGKKEEREREREREKKKKKRGREREGTVNEKDDCLPLLSSFFLSLYM